MPVAVDRCSRGSDGNRRLAARDQRREDGAQFSVAVMRSTREHESQAIPRELGPRRDAWIGRFELDACVVEVFEGARRGQQARFVGRGLSPATGMPPQHRRKGESTTLDSQGIGH